MNKLEQSLTFISEYANTQLEYEDNDNETLIEQLATENINLRSLLDINIDLSRVEPQIKLLEAELYSKVDDNSGHNHQISAMIEEASKGIKERARQKKEEDKVNDEASAINLTLDGKPEEFPFKNIKPKKAYLLMGGQLSSQPEDTVAEDTVVQGP